MSGLAPRAPGDSVRPRRLVGVVVRPLNFTVSCHVRTSARWFTSLPCSAFGAMLVATAKSQCEELVDVVMPFAEKMLAAHGEFYPFAASMKPSGEITQVAAYDGRERPPSQPLIDSRRDGFNADAKAGVIIASDIA